MVFALHADPLAAHRAIGASQWRSVGSGCKVLVEMCIQCMDRGVPDRAASYRLDLFVSRMFFAYEQGIDLYGIFPIWSVNFDGKNHFIGIFPLTLTELRFFPLNFD